MIQREKWRKRLAVLIAWIGVMLGWQLLVVFSQLPQYVLPTPITVWYKAVEEFPDLLPHCWATLQLIVGGLLGGVVAGCVVATVLHVSPPVRYALFPLLVSAQNVPVIVIAPFFVVWFGFGVLPKLILVAGVCFFPIVMNVFDGMERVDPSLQRYFAISGAKRWQRLWYLSWPSAIPALFTGMKLAATYSVLGAVISEWIGAPAGLGVYMLLKKASFDVAALFVVVIIIVLISVLLVRLISEGERLCTRWHER